MKRCPMPECRTVIKDHRFCCERHWVDVSDLGRSRINDAYWSFRHNEISLNDLRLVEASVVELISGVPTAPRVCFRRVTCRRCGSSSILAHRKDGSGMIAVEELSGDGRDNVPLYVVKGFVALPAIGFAGSYTLFREHDCQSPLWARSTPCPVVPSPTPTTSRVATPSG